MRQLRARVTGVLTVVAKNFLGANSQIEGPSRTPLGPAHPF